MQEFQILDYDRKSQRVFSKAKERISSENLVLIKNYDAEMATLGLKKSTRVKQIAILVDITVRINKSWSDVLKEDIDGLIRNVMDRFGDSLGGESETTRDYKKSLKPFFRWLKFDSRDFREVGDPPELKSIRLKQVRDKIVREQLLTEDDHGKLIRACADNARDQAFLDVHYEAGTRPGEVLSLKIKHVKFDKMGAIINVDGKTGPRPIRLITSVPNLAKWMNAHPFKDDPEHSIPNSVTISLGDTVRWINADTAAHTVTSGTVIEGPDGKFDSGLLLSGNFFEFTFEDTGTFEYFDLVHPWVTGTVIVN